MHWQILEADGVRERLRRRGARIIRLPLDLDALRHIHLSVGEHSLTITPRRALDGDRQHVAAAVDRRAEFEHAPVTLKNLGGHEKYQLPRRAHARLELRQFLEVLAVDEDPIARVRQPVVHARDEVLAVRALVRQEAVVGLDDVLDRCRDGRDLDALIRRRQRRRDALAQFRVRRDDLRAAERLDLLLQPFGLVVGFTD